METKCDNSISAQNFSEHKDASSKSEDFDSVGQRWGF